MKTRKYKNGKSTAKTYFKKVGSGYEVGFVYAGKTVFVGNFVHSTEANKFYTQMNREITSFAKRVKVGKSYPQSWFRSFVKAHLERSYYNFVNKQVRKHASTANRNYNKNLRTYKRLTRRWTGSKTPCLKAA